MLKIGEFSVLTGIPATSLRYYNDIGLLEPAHNDPQNGYRYYSYAQLHDANRLLTLRDLGFSLDELAEMMGNRLSPGKIRHALKTQRKLIQQRIEDDQRRLLVVENTLRDVEMEGRLSKFGIRLKRLEPCRALTIRGFGESVEGLDTFIEGLVQQLQTYPIHPSGARRTMFYDLVYPETNIEIEVALPTTSRLKVQPPAQYRTLEGYPLVASVFCPKRKDITRAWTELREWIDRNGYRIVGAFTEILLTDEVMELLFPIEKA
jgi:DNA-binding transcriptional MerR regulator